VNALCFSLYVNFLNKSYDTIIHMSIPNYAYCEPLPLGGYIFGADFDLEWTGSQFTAKWSNFKVSDADNSVQVSDVALNPNYVYPLGGNIVAKPYFASLSGDLKLGWHPCGVCGHPGYPAFYNFDPTTTVFSSCLSHTFPRIVHLGSYLQQSDAAHPPNVDFLMIVEDEVPGMQPPRYRANFAEFFFKARHELPPGTVLYADIAAFLAFVAWTPEAQQNYEDPGWDEPFPASEVGVFILEARIGALDESMDTSVLGAGVGDTAGSSDSHASASAVTSLLDRSEREFGGRSQFLEDDASSTASTGIVPSSALAAAQASTGIVQSAGLAAAQAFLTLRGERSETEKAVILDAREGRTPARSSLDNGYLMISKPGSPHRDWAAMIAYLVTKLEVSRRPVTAQDLRQLKRWAHNHDAVLRRAAPVGASTPKVGTDMCQDGGASSIVRGAKKRARAEEVATTVGGVQVSSFPVRARKGPRLFDPHGPPTEGDFVSAGRQSFVPDFGAVSSSSGIRASALVDSSVPHTAVEVPTIAGPSVVVDSAPVVRASRAAPFVRNSEVGRGAILQAEVILAAALRELDSVRAAIVDCTSIVLRGIDSARASVNDSTAAVALARRHLGLDRADDQ
jgi:hypothetical protein